MFKKAFFRPLLLVPITALLTLGGTALAQPTDNPGRGNGASQGKGPGDVVKPHKEKGQGNGQHKQKSRSGDDDHRYREDNRYHEDRADRDYWDDRDGPVFEESEIRRIFEQRRDWLSRDEIESLPPGIRKNLARGKPLPPGIAKRFDDRLVQELPRYPGYEWRRAGTDAILVDATNEIIYRVLTDILR